MRTPEKATLITNKSNIRYLSNFTGSSGFMLLTKDKKYFFTDFRYLQRAKNGIKKGIILVDATRMWKNPEILKKNWHKILIKHKIKIIEIEESNMTIDLLKRFKKISKIKRQKIKFRKSENPIEPLREQKSKEEIKFIEKSQRINEKVFLSIKKIIQDFCSSKQQKQPITEKHLAWKIREFGYLYGADNLSFEPIVAFGKHSSIPHHESGNAKLKKEDIILIDMGMKYKGYCSDMTRIIFTAPPTKEQKEIYNIVLKAQQTAINKIHIGITGKSSDRFARKIIEKAGHSENYGHASGHGVGLDIHESPSLSEHYTKKLKENSIITVEPGIYLPGKFGIRIEDMILLTKSGSKNLTKIKKSL